MPASYSTRLRLMLQATGENLATWGQKLNLYALSLIDDAIAGAVHLTVNGNVTLTSLNGTSDQARKAVLIVDAGGGGTITIPAVEKSYLVINLAAGAVTVTCGGTGTVTVPATARSQVYCDGSNVLLAGNSSLNGLRLRNVGTPLDASDAATKAYADGLAIAASGAQLPGQAGADYQFLRSVGGMASWNDPLPEQSGHAKQYLKTTGVSRTGAFWGPIGESYTFTASGTWVVPDPPPSYMVLRLRGGGGGGGSGGKQTTTGTGQGAAGGSGGGGAEYLSVELIGPDVPAAGTILTITVGAGGAGGVSQTLGDTNGNNGADGGDTSIFGYLAHGGKHGFGGVGGGSPYSANPGGNGGGLSAASGIGGYAVGHQYATAPGASTAGSSEFGGAAGGGPATGSGSGYSGGASLYGGSGGDGGGGVINGTVLGAGPRGGGGVLAGNAGPGQAGTLGGGGSGGGGVYGSGNSGAGGNGAPGYVQIWHP